MEGRMTPEEARELGRRNAAAGFESSAPILAPEIVEAVGDIRVGNPYTRQIFQSYAWGFESEVDSQYREMMKSHKRFAKMKGGK